MMLIEGKFRVCDAEGVECPKVYECDTETGRVLRFKQDDDGNLCCDDTKMGLIVEEVYLPAPLRLEGRFRLARHQNAPPT